MAQLTITIDDAREAILQAEANRTSATRGDIALFALNRYLDERAARQKAERGQLLTQTWDRLTTEEKKGIDDLLAEKNPPEDR